MLPALLAKNSVEIELRRLEVGHQRNARLQLDRRVAGEEIARVLPVGRCDFDLLQERVIFLEGQARLQRHRPQLRLRIGLAVLVHERLHPQRAGNRCNSFCGIFAIEGIDEARSFDRRQLDAEFERVPGFVLACAHPDRQNLIVVAQLASSLPWAEQRLRR